MTRLFHPIMMLLSNSKYREMAAKIVFLVAENKSLRKRLPKRIILEQSEKRRLAKLASAIKGSLKELTTIASPKTILKWIREFEQPSNTPKPVKRKPGRPRKKQ